MATDFHSIVIYVQTGVIWLLLFMLYRQNRRSREALEAMRRVGDFDILAKRIMDCSTSDVITTVGDDE
jgi:hypothetical protein